MIRPNMTNIMSNRDTISNSMQKEVMISRHLINIMLDTTKELKHKHRRNMIIRPVPITLDMTKETRRVTMEQLRSTTTLQLHSTLDMTRTGNRLLQPGKLTQRDMTTMRNTIRTMTKAMLATINKDRAIPAMTSRVSILPKVLHNRSINTQKGSTTLMRMTTHRATRDMIKQAKAMPKKTSATNKVHTPFSENPFSFLFRTGSTSTIRPPTAGRDSKTICHRQSICWSAAI